MKFRPITRLELLLAQCALMVAILLQIAAWVINPDLAYGPHNLIIITELVLAVFLGLNAHLKNGEAKPVYRTLSFILMGLISLANITSFFLVSRMLINGDHLLSGKELIVAALAIFLTNIIVFALWYWEIDSPGFTGRKWSKNDKDFQFTQQDLPKDFPDWQPGFVDYLYLSLTNGINFAAADARPLTWTAKCLMGIQALVSVFTLALVLARSISFLG